MPSPYDMQHRHNTAAADHLRGLAGLFRSPEEDLAVEVRGLRSEIAQLRAELKPASSLILTGQQVAAEFQRLSGSCA